jgi:uncharacterized membrane protein
MITRKIYRPTVLTLLAVAVIIAVIAATAGFIFGRAPLLGELIPVRFDPNGRPDRWVRFSYSLILLPVWIQLTLAIVFGALGGLLLYRTNPRSPHAVENEVVKQERERMLVTAEAVSLLTAVWVIFQGFAALRIVWLWQRWEGDLGGAYLQSLVVAIVLSVIVGIRAGVNLKYANPASRETKDIHWRLQGLYFNRQDPALFVPLRSGVGWTLNFGRLRALVFLLVFLAFGILVPVLLLRLLSGQ